MRFLTDENIARSILVQLRDAGHDVLSVTESSAVGRCRSHE